MSLQLNEWTVGQLVAERPSRARVFERFGIDYCCGGKKPLQQACREKDLDMSVVLRELDQNHIQEAGARNWASASLTDLCDHIEQTHHAYLKQELPRLELLTRKIAARHGESRPELSQVHQVFVALKAEMDEHMMKEERVLFPLCRKLDSADVLPAMHCGIRNPIQVMIAEHEHAGNALEQIRQLTGNYTAPPDACNTFLATFDSLQQLERDLHQHVHKENNILFPKAARREALLAKASK